MFMARSKLLAMVVGALAACTSADGERKEYRLTLSNNNGFDVARVALVVGVVEAGAFADILARATTPALELTLVAGAVVEISCSDGGCQSGRIQLLADQENAIVITRNSKPYLLPPYENLPAVTELWPPDGSTGVGRNASVQVTFSHPMSPATVTASQSGTACTGSVRLSANDFATCVAMAATPATTDDQTFTLTPAAALEPLTTYRVMVTGAAEDTIGAFLRVDFVSAGFVTASSADATAPDAIADLAIGTITESSVQLTWTAVGDDGATGTAASYDLRYAHGACPMVFAAATAVLAPPPAAAGAVESFVVSPLDSGAEYCFALTALDEVQNTSPESNDVSGTLLVSTDATPPTPPSLSFATVGSTSLKVQWTATGDDGSTGTAAYQTLRYAVAPNCPAHDGATFSSGTVVSGLGAPQAAGTAESAWVYNLQSTKAYCFVLSVSDEVPNPVFSPSAQVTTTAPDTFW
jgi:hypothetical protein